MPRNEMSPIKLIGTRGRETEAAVLFTVEEIVGKGKLSEPVQLWFPFSQISSSQTDPESVGKDYILASHWICTKKELV